jgi:hypothetical protein
VNRIAEDALAAIADQGHADMPAYAAALRRACDGVTPLFGRPAYGEAYLAAAVDPNWMALSLVTNAEREGDGAGRLWDLAACTHDAEVSAQIRQHGLDESMHSRAYVALLDLAFPGALGGELRPHVLALSPGFGPSDTPVAQPGSPYSHAATLDDLVQMNIAEIRTRLHHLMQRPLLALHCPEAHRDRLVAILERLLADETKHVAYTAALIERHAATDPEAVDTLMRQRLRDFDEITEDEFAKRVFD